MQPPADLMVVDHVRLRVVLTQVREGEPGQQGPVQEQLALLLDLSGHRNNSAEPRATEVILDTATAAKLAGGLLECLDAMRAHSNARPD